MSPEQFSVYRHEAVHQLMRLNEECEKTYQLSSCPRWDYDLEAGTLTFSENGIPKIIASIQVIGTTSKSGGTWMWAWANESLPDKVTRAVESVRAFGLAENLTELTKESLPDSEYIGWEMSSVAAGILHAKGAYRCPDDNGFVYVVYTSLRFADDQIESPETGKQIDCATHGGGFSTYVCEHLAANPAQEWFSRERDDAHPWPDAWCALCDAFFQAEGEWNEKNEGKLKVKLLCHHCYATKRSQETFPFHRN